MNDALLLRQVLLLLSVGIFSPAGFTAEARTIFALDQGNSWTYQFQTDISTTVVGNDDSLQVPANNKSNVSVNFSITDGTPAQMDLLKLTGDASGDPFTVTFQNPLPYLWYPMQIGETRIAKRIPVEASVVGTNVKGNAWIYTKVLGREIVQLPFGQVNAYKLRRGLYIKFKVGILGISQGIIKHDWFVPNLGVVASGTLTEELNEANILSTFLLRDGKFTEQTDTDEDGLKDWQELAVSGTNPELIDSDQDAVSDSLDNCPMVANADQLDGDRDGTGDVCEITQPGAAVKGLLLDAARVDHDTLGVTIRKCDGLADAILRLRTDTPVSLTVGSTTYSLTGADLVKVKSGLSANFAEDKGKLRLFPLDGHIKVNGKRLELGNLENPILLRLEIGGWSCQSSEQWRTTRFNGKTRYRSPAVSG
jgi:hypothetical protein